MKTLFHRRIIQTGSILIAAFLGYLVGHLDSAALMQTPSGGQRPAASGDAAAAAPRAADAAAPRAAAAPDSGLTGVSLPPYPAGGPGDRTPFDIWKYAGRGKSSWGNPILPMSFSEWMAFHKAQKPKLMADVRAYMATRFEFSGRAIAGVTMTRGKPIMAGPIAKLAPGLTFEQLSQMSADDIKARDAFPYKPLAHPLQTTAHMIFPAQWTKVHPEHERIDVDLDLPDQYLPEFPPPMFLTTHKELGDVSQGKEVTLQNYFQIFNGLLTPEQMEGLKELLKPTPTTWFNQTEFRVTAEPSNGVNCFSCHVNGHTNGAIALAPDSRPNQARLRVDTPSLRGNFDMMQLSSKRSIRSTDHFSEVEEYFDGDQGMMTAIGPRAAQRQVTNRMGDFNALLDFPPAPKLSPLMKLIPEQSTASELRGEALFRGKAQCSTCHYGPAFTDEYMHDLQVERFYVGRPEGPIKTFALRGIKDSPPYLHDGRLLTLHDAVEFFDVVLGLRLTKQETEDLVAYLLCL